MSFLSSIPGNTDKNARQDRSAITAVKLVVARTGSMEQGAVVNCIPRLAALLELLLRVNGILVAHLKTYE